MCQACGGVVREDQEHLTQCEGYKDLRGDADLELVKFFSRLMDRRKEDDWDQAIVRDCCTAAQPESSCSSQIVAMSNYLSTIYLIFDSGLNVHIMDSLCLILYECDSFLSTNTYFPDYAAVTHIFIPHFHPPLEPDIFLRA